MTTWLQQREAAGHRGLPAPVPPAVSREQGRPHACRWHLLPSDGQSRSGEQLGVPARPTAGSDGRHRLHVRLEPGARPDLEEAVAAVLRLGPQTSRSDPKANAAEQTGFSGRGRKHNASPRTETQAVDRDVPTKRAERDESLST